MLITASTKIILEGIFQKFIYKGYSKKLKIPFSLKIKFLAIVIPSNVLKFLFSTFLSKLFVDVRKKNFRFDFAIVTVQVTP